MDLRAYLNRIEVEDDLHPDYATLERLHLAHVTHIPFENLDILLGRPIRFDLESLEAKLVKGHRGGYCFEHNHLFAAALKELGLSVIPLAARVRYRTQHTLPRTHMLLLVEVEGSRYVADVGFGAEGLLMPVPFEFAQPVRQFAWTFRVVEDSGLWVLQSLREAVWTDLYAFTLEPQHFIDYEMANHYTSTHPNSRFVRMLTVQLQSTEVRNMLKNWELVRDTGETVTSRILANDEELLAVLADVFGLRFPPGTRFSFQEEAVP